LISKNGLLHQHEEESSGPKEAYNQGVKQPNETIREDDNDDDEAQFPLKSSDNSTALNKSRKTTSG